MIPITKDLNAEMVVIEDPEKTEGNLNKSVQKAIKKPLIFKPHSPSLLQILCYYFTGADPISHFLLI